MMPRNDSTMAGATALQSVRYAHWRPNTKPSTVARPCGNSTVWMFTSPTLNGGFGSIVRNAKRGSEGHDGFSVQAYGNTRWRSATVFAEP